MNHNLFPISVFAYFFKRVVFQNENENLAPITSQVTWKSFWLILSQKFKLKWQKINISFFTFWFLTFNQHFRLCFVLFKNYIKHPIRIVSLRHINVHKSMILCLYRQQLIFVLLLLFQLLQTNLTSHVHQYLLYVNHRLNIQDILFFLIGNKISHQQKINSNDSYIIMMIPSPIDSNDTHLTDSIDRV